MDADFRIFSGRLKAADLDGRKVINTTASSSIVDRHGDQFTTDAIRSMAASALGSSMTIFLNHDYDVPEDVFGTVVNSTAVQRGADTIGNPIWDLDLEVMVDETNPRALQTYRSLRGPKDDGNGVKLGVSIGALIHDYELKDPKDPWSPMTIKDVELLEASIVGIPANPGSWVRNAIKSLRPKKDAETAEFSAVAGNRDAQMVARLMQERGAPVVEIEVKAAEAAPEPVINDEATEEAPIVEAAVEPAVTEETEPVDEEATLAAAQKYIDGTEQPAPVVELPAAEEQSGPETEIDAALEKSFESVIKSATEQVRVLNTQLEVLRSENATVKSERDDAVASLKLAIKFVEKLANTPLGRKTSFAPTIDGFRRNLAGVYDEEFLEFLPKE